jgi:hypothetical protein
MRRSIVRVAASAAAAVAIAGALAACGDEKTAGRPAPAGNAQDAAKRAAEAIADARATAEKSLSRAHAVCDRAVEIARTHSQDLADRTQDVCETSLEAGHGGAVAGAQAGEDAAEAVEKALDEIGQR